MVDRSDVDILLDAVAGHTNGRDVLGGEEKGGVEHILG